MKAINITPLMKKYGPGYVAKDKKTGKIVAFASGLKLLFKKTGKRSDLEVSWIPKLGARYVFRISF